MRNDLTACFIWFKGVRASTEKNRHWTKIILSRFYFIVSVSSRCCLIRAFVWIYVFVRLFCDGAIVNSTKNGDIGRMNEKKNGNMRIY